MWQAAVGRPGGQVGGGITGGDRRGFLVSRESSLITISSFV